MNSTKVLSELGTEIQETFIQNKQVLAFSEWFVLLHNSPTVHARSAAQYVLDTFNHYGISDPEEISMSAGMIWSLSA